MEHAPGGEGAVLEQLDPMARVVGELRPPTGGLLPVPAGTLDQLAQELVRRFSLSGNGRHGAVRLEFGSGLLDGGSLLVECEGETVSVQVDPPADMSAPELQNFVRGLQQRLSRRGVNVAALEVKR